MIFKTFLFIFFFIKEIESKNLLEQEILENKNVFSINLIENNFLIKEVFSFCDNEIFSFLYCKNNLDEYINNVVLFCLKTNKIEQLDNVFEAIYKVSNKININNLFGIINNINEYDFSLLKKENIKFFSIITQILNNNIYKILNNTNNYIILENFYLNFFTWSKNEKQNFFYFKEILIFFKRFKYTFPTFTQINNTVLYLYKIMLNNPNIYTNDVLVKRFFYNFYYQYFLDQNTTNNFLITNVNDYVLKNKTIKENNNTFMFFYYREIGIDENIKEIVKNIFLTFDDKKIPLLNNLYFFIYNNFFEYEIYTNYYNVHGHINKVNNTINVYMYLNQLNNITYIPILIKKLYIYNYINYDLKNIPLWFVESLSKSLSDQKDFCVDKKNINYKFNTNISYNEYLLNIDFIDKKIFFFTKYNLKQILSFLEKREIDYDLLNAYDLKNLNLVCLENKNPKHIFNLERIIAQKNIILEYNNYYINISENNIDFLSKNKNQLHYAKNYYLKEFRNSIEKYILDFSIKKQNNILNIYNNNFSPFFLNNYNFFIIFFTYILRNNFNFYLKYVNTDMKEKEIYFLEFINKEKNKKKDCENNINKILIPDKKFSSYNFVYDLILKENNYQKFKIKKEALRNKINDKYTLKDVLIRFKYKYIDEEYVMKENKEYSNFICFKEHEIESKTNTQNSFDVLNNKINILNEENSKHFDQILNVLKNTPKEIFNETIFVEKIQDEFKKNFNVINFILKDFLNNLKTNLEKFNSFFYNITVSTNKKNLESFNTNFINTNKNSENNYLFLFLVNMFLIIIVCVLIYLFYLY